VSKNIIIIGAGGHGKVIADLALKCGYNVTGFLDNDSQKKKILHYPVLGKISDARLWKEDSEFIIAIGDNYARQKTAEEYIDLDWAILVHPSAQIGLDVEIGKGTVVFSNVVINSSTKIGVHCIINTSAVIEHDNIVGDFVHISPGSILCGTVFIGLRTHIGVGGIVRNNISICKDCVIGAGAVVTKNIEESGIFVGVPTKKLK
jgi:sugar O-acyltransferase (sialic acid O-acetyltransferase NeuD family)